MKPLNILLLHLVANGDCLMATTIARQIKHDYPGCRLTWAISFKCRQVVDNNPDVDAVWEVAYGAEESPAGGVWRRIRREAEARRARGEFDLVFYTQIYPDNVSKYDGTTRPSTFRCYPHPITVPVAPVVRLREQEIERVRRFAEERGLPRHRVVILLECAPGSGQSALNLPKGIELAGRIVAAREDAVVIVSTHLPFQPRHPRVIDGSCLSFRENAALSHFCTLLVGCSSGITWLLTSEAAKPLPTVQFLNRQAMASSFASVAYDFAHWGLATDAILENDGETVDAMMAVVLDALADFGAARERHHRQFKPAFWDFLCFCDYHSLCGFARLPGTFRLFMRRNRFLWRDALHLGSLRRVAVYVLGSTRRWLAGRLRLRPSRKA